ncbi:hypothetical protein LZ31DRAFT_49514 [Colletotrichum somersetense]|nr:hypothetical protein LZ31DRAFT_49514 [Colletotrichum somersetense]
MGRRRHPCRSCHQPVLLFFSSNRGVIISHGEPLQHSPDAAALVEARWDSFRVLLRRCAPPMLKVGSGKKGRPHSQRGLNANGGAIDISTCAPRCHQEGSNSSSFSVPLCPRQSISTPLFDLGLPDMYIETQAVEADIPQSIPLISNMDLGRGPGWEMKNPRSPSEDEERRGLLQRRDAATWHTYQNHLFVHQTTRSRPKRAGVSVCTVIFFLFHH